MYPTRERYISLREALLSRWLSRFFKRSPSIEERAANVGELLNSTLADYLVYCPPGSDENFNGQELDNLISAYATDAELPIPTEYVLRLEAVRERPVPKSITDVATALPMSRLSHWILAFDVIAQAYAVDLAVTTPLLIDLLTSAAQQRVLESRDLVSDAAAFCAWFLMDAEEGRNRGEGLTTETLPSLNAMMHWMYRPSARALAFIFQFKSFRRAYLPSDESSRADITRFLFGLDELLDALVCGGPAPEIRSLQRTWADRPVSEKFTPRDAIIRMETRLRGLIIASEHFHGGIFAFSADLRSRN